MAPKHTVERKDDKRDAPLSAYEMRDFKPTKDISQPHFDNITAVNDAFGHDAIKNDIVYSNSYSFEPSRESVKDPIINLDILELTVVLQYNEIEAEMSFNIHRERSILDVYNRVEMWLKDENVLPSYIQFIDFVLMHRGMQLKDTDSLQQSGIVTDAKIFVFLEVDRPVPEKPVEVTVIKQPIGSPQPKPPREGYTTEPSFDVLQRMSIEELQAVPNLKI